MLKKKDGCKKGYLHIGKNCYPRVSITREGSIHDYYDRMIDNTVEMFNDEKEVRSIQRELGDHPSVREFKGFIISRTDKQNIIDAYGIYEKIPFPKVPVFRIRIEG